MVKWTKSTFAQIHIFNMVVFQHKHKKVGFFLIFIMEASVLLLNFDKYVQTYGKHVTFKYSCSKKYFKTYN
jgi:hypothetical protein